MATIIAIPVALLVEGWRDDSATGGAATPSPTPVVSSSASDDAIQVAVAQDRDHCFYQFLVDGAPSTIPDPNLAGGVSRWVDSLDAVSADLSGMELTVNGTSEAPVTVREIRAVVTGRTEPPTGTKTQVGCGEGRGYSYVRFDLDKDPPAVSTGIEGESLDPTKKLVPLRFPVEVPRGRQASFYVQGVVSRFDVSWEIEIEWSSAGRTGTTRVRDEDGKPFRVAASNSVTATCTWTEQGQLMAAESQDCDR
ncbi:MAG: hypothetical protein ACRCYU_19425 [Nocardioides sp.]